MCFGQRDLDPPDASSRTASSSSCSTPPATSRCEDARPACCKTAEHDRRWVKIRRPTVVVGGELTHRHPGNPPRPAQQRQRGPAAAEEQLRLPADRRLRPPADRARRAAQPLDRPAGEPARLPDAGHRQEDPGALRAAHHLLDEPGAERPGRRGLPAPHSRTRSRSAIRTSASSTRLFELYARQFDCEYRPEVVDNLMTKHYRPHGRPLRRCHPRDLLSQVRNYCRYNDLPVEMRPEYFDRVVPQLLHGADRRERGRPDEGRRQGALADESHDEGYRRVGGDPRNRLVPGGRRRTGGAPQRVRVHTTPYTIGRRPEMNLSLSCASVSGRHAELVSDGDVLVGPRPGQHQRHVRQRQRRPLGDRA